MKRTISNIFCGVAFLLATLAGTSCDDWTKNEKIAVEDPVFGEGDPAEHIPPARRGMLGALTAEQVTKLRETIRRYL